MIAHFIFQDESQWPPVMNISDYDFALAFYICFSIVSNSNANAALSRMRTPSLGLVFRYLVEIGVGLANPPQAELVQARPGQATPGHANFGQATSNQA